MKIVIDIQACQSPASRNRGIGRYSHSLAYSIAKQSPENVWLFLSDLHSDGMIEVLDKFKNVLPPEKFIIWRTPEIVSEFDLNLVDERVRAQKEREAFLSCLQPDFVHISSLFEINENCVSSVGLVKADSATSATLYDLIPLAHKERYLVDKNSSEWYYRKIEELKKTEMLLAISDFSRSEAIDLLQYDQNAIFSIYGAADSHFRKKTITEGDRIKIKETYGIHKPFVMYTGGIDFRKNIDGLIEAYAILPGDIRQTHQLVIVCKVLESEKQHLLDVARKNGLNDGELVITGFVPDNDLLSFYNMCKLFVFPSWHEGFGLPVLEAMSCGAPVIGASAASLPEIIGLNEALFNPFVKEDISKSIFRALTDSSFRDQLIENGYTRIKDYSWDRSGSIALDAFKCMYEKKNKKEMATVYINDKNHKPKIAYVSPLPPEKTGIANYSNDLLPFLANHYDIDIIVDQHVTSIGNLPENCNVYDKTQLKNHAQEYHVILYHFGNSMFHRYMHDLINIYPGIVVLHDFYLSGPLMHLDISGDVPGCWGLELFESHGYHAVRDLCMSHDYIKNLWKYPCNRTLINNSTGVIVHSNHSKELAEHWYGVGAADHWVHIPHLKEPILIDKLQARKAVSIDENKFVVCSFGILGRAKLNHRLINAWMNSPLSKDSNSLLIFVGENIDGGYAAELNELISSYQSKINNIKITGFVDNNNYSQYLSASDIAVQLRGFSRGETSGAALDCMARGLPLIVNAHATMNELPNVAVCKLPDEFTDIQLIDALVELKENPSRRKILGFEATHWLKRMHKPEVVAAQYADAIESIRGGHLSNLNQLMLSDKVTAPLCDEIKISTKLSLESVSGRFGARKLYVDVSALVSVNAGTGIQRVVIGLLKSMLLNPPAGVQIEPVYLNSDGRFWTARRFCTSFMDYGYAGFALGLNDSCIDVISGDVFLGLDLHTNSMSARVENYETFKSLGCKINTIVYDLIPLKNPQWFSANDVGRFKEWFGIIVEHSTGIYCISDSVADDVRDFLTLSDTINRVECVIDSFKIGCIYSDDIESTITYRKTKFVNYLNNDQKNFAFNFLAVGTVEPRKGYLQLIDAFGELWQKENIDVNLTIVGRQGWLCEDIVARIRNHPEYNKKLIWLSDATDSQLSLLYENSTALIVSSEDEGLGMPILEASAKGLPVIARNIKPFVEIGKSGVSYFDSITSSGLKEFLIEWIKKYIKKQIPDQRNVPIYSWSDSAADLLDKILSNDPSKHPMGYSEKNADLLHNCIYFKNFPEQFKHEKFVKGIVESTGCNELVVGLISYRDTPGTYTTLKEIGYTIPSGIHELNVSMPSLNDPIITANINSDTFTAKLPGGEDKHAIKFLLRCCDNNEHLYEHVLPIVIDDGLHCTSGHLAESNNDDLNIVRIVAPTIRIKDAVGNYIFNTCDLFERNGIRYQLYADGFDIANSFRIKKVSQLYVDLKPSDLILVVYSIYDFNLERIVGLENKKIVIFQNVTPGDFFEKWDQNTANLCHKSIGQLPKLYNFDMVFASTMYSAYTLDSHWVIKKDIDLLPPFYPWQLDKFDLSNPPRSKKTKLLFVGRLAPNKRIDDLIKMFHEYLKFNWEAKLTIVGDGNAKYKNYIFELIHSLAFSEGQVEIFSSISDDQIVDIYKTHNAFVCMSEHEGYCVPLVEAMASQLPIFAYPQPAVHEVTGDTAMLIDHRKYWEWAQTISQTLADWDRVLRMIDKQNYRLQQILRNATGERLISAIKCPSNISRI